MCILFSMIYSDFDAITDPIMKAKMVALKGINKMMVQNNMGMTSMVVNKWVYSLVCLTEILFYLFQCVCACALMAHPLFLFSQNPN